MATWETIGTVITIAGGIGFGTLAAGLITARATKATALSQLRQSWTDALRSDLVSYFQAADYFQETGDRHTSAMEAYRKVLLRLNLRERRHVRLERRLLVLLDNQPLMISTVETSMSL